MKKRCSYCGETLTKINKKLIEKEKYLKFSMCHRCDTNVLLFLNKCVDMIDSLESTHKTLEERECSQD